MNILVTGANGQLGRCVRDADKNPSDKYFYTDVDELDITDEKAVDGIVRTHDIKVIINCAAYTNVDRAEEPKEKELVEKVNTEAVRILAKAARETDALLIHISTDYVFGGNLNNAPCREDQIPNPTGVYGRTKLEAERIIEQSGCRYIILRTAWLYSEYGKNFVKTMFFLLQTKDELKVVFDQCGTPTYARDLANAIVDIVNTGDYEGKDGIYHFSNEGVCSWFDFTKMIGEFSGLKNCRVKPCHSEEFPSKVVRPAYSVLDKTKFKTTFNKEIPYWTDSLKKCVVNLMKVS